MDETKKIEFAFKEREIEQKERQLSLDWHKYTLEHSRPHIEAAFKYAELSLRSILILNGAAAISLMSFSASKLNDGKINLSNAILYFAIGSFLSVLSAAFSYFSQYGYASHIANKESKFWLWWGRISHIIVIILFFSALFMFYFGGYNTYLALRPA